MVTVQMERVIPRRRAVRQGPGQASEHPPGAGTSVESSDRIHAAVALSRSALRELAPRPCAGGVADRAVTSLPLTALGEDDFVAALLAVGELSRVVDALRILVCGELDGRTAGLSVPDSLAKRLGFHGTRDVLAAVFGAESAQVGRWLALANVTAPRDGGSTGWLEPTRPLVARALNAGWISADQASTIHRSLPDPRLPEHTPGLHESAERSVTDFASGRQHCGGEADAVPPVPRDDVGDGLIESRIPAHPEAAGWHAGGAPRQDEAGHWTLRYAPRQLAAQCEAWSALIDADGVEPAYEEQRRKRCFKMLRQAGGGWRLSGFAPALEGGALQTLLDAYQSPRHSPRQGRAAGNTTGAPVDGAADGPEADGCEVDGGDSADGGGAPHEAPDERSRDQIAFDVLFGLADSHVRSGTAPTSGGAAPTLLVTVTHEALMRHLGGEPAQATPAQTTPARGTTVQGNTAPGRTAQAGRSSGPPQVPGPGLGQVPVLQLPTRPAVVMPPWLGEGQRPFRPTGLRPPVPRRGPVKPTVPPTVLTTVQLGGPTPHPMGHGTRDHAPVDQGTGGQASVGQGTGWGQNPDKDVNFDDFVWPAQPSQPSRPSQPNHAPPPEEGALRSPVDHALNAIFARSSRSNTVVPVAEALRMLCNDKLQLMITSAEGLPLRLGRTRRTFSPSQRTALIARDRHCRAPGCDLPGGWCEAHHVMQWSSGGQTDVENGILLCGFHHHEVHAGRLSIIEAAGDKSDPTPWHVTQPWRLPR